MAECGVDYNKLPPYTSSNLRFEDRESKMGAISVKADTLRDSHGNCAQCPQSVRVINQSNGKLRIIRRHLIQTVILCNTHNEK